jgi:hypothetical protein
MESMDSMDLSSSCVKCSTELVEYQIFLKRKIGQRVRWLSTNSCYIIKIMVYSYSYMAGLKVFDNLDFSGEIL